MGRATSRSLWLEHRQALDGVRALALIAVLLYHLQDVLWPGAGRWLLPGGSAGLDLFFALSGFLITCLLLGEFNRHSRIDLPGFLGRRARRLFPALVTVLAAVFLGAAVGASMHSPSEVATKSLWTMTFLQNWSFEQRTLTEMGQTWSLAVEGQFYLLWSTVVAVTLMTFRRARVLLLGIAVLAVVVIMAVRTIRFHNGDNFYVVYLATGSRIDGPLLGAAGGIAYMSGWTHRVPQRWVNLLTGSGLAILLLIAITTSPSDDYSRLWGGYTINALVGTVVVVGAALLAPGRFRRLLSARPLVYLGVTSYSLFLWHLPVYFYLSRHAEGWATVPRAAVALAVTFVCGALSYELIERRFLNRRLDPRVEPDVAPVAGAPAPEPTTQGDVARTG